jgi:NAD(P)-dependent dehydrogenase (short-subunit alcohol dehydrogenase family)
MKKNQDLFNGKVVLVTGAAQGIGKAIAKAFARESASVVVADIQESAGEAAACEIRNAGMNARFVKADLRRETDIEKMVSFTSDSFGHLDVLINNARPKLRQLPFAESMEEWDLAMDVFLKAPALVTKHALPLLVKSGSGSIINISSINAFYIASHQPVAYHVAKAGLLQLTRYMAVEFGPHNIRVNTVCPGIVDRKDGGESLTADPTNKAVAEIVVPLQRASSPEEVADSVMFLCSDAAAYITGQILTLDGGETLGDHFHIARKAFNAARELER